jgi:hypothetical protein
MSTFSIQSPPKYIKIVIFGMQVYHLATLSERENQGDQIGRIFDHRIIVHSRQFFCTQLQKYGHIFGRFFHVNGYALMLAKNGLGYIMGEFFSQTHLGSML